MNMMQIYSKPATDYHSLSPTTLTLLEKEKSLQGYKRRQYLRGPGMLKGLAEAPPDR